MVLDIILCSMCTERGYPDHAQRSKGILTAHDHNLPISSCGPGSMTHAASVLWCALSVLLSIALCASGWPSDSGYRFMDGHPRVGARVDDTYTHRTTT